jgi:hypothetical protein
VQGSADADHPRSKDEDIGPQFHHRALQKSNAARLRPLPIVKLVIAASPRKPGYWNAETGLRGGQALGQHGSLKAADIISGNGSGHSGEVKKCR